MGAVDPANAVETARAVALAFLSTQAPGNRVRFRDMDDAAFKRVCDAVALLFRNERISKRERAAERPVGTLLHTGTVFAAGIAVPFGRIEAGALRILADAIAEAGGKGIRVSPWRTLYVPVFDEAHARRLLQTARALGFITESGDPLLGIEACPGAPACRSGLADTRTAARAVAEMRARLTGVSTIHISGCGKGCACPGRSDLVLAGGPEGFRIVRNGKASDAGEAILHPNGLAQLPEIVARLTREQTHA
jgi:precorrin-3B synthase